jgi:hypothetical protein
VERREGALRDEKNGSKTEVVNEVRAGIDVVHSAEVKSKTKAQEGNPHRRRMRIRDCFGAGLVGKLPMD